MTVTAESVAGAVVGATATGVGAGRDGRGASAGPLWPQAESTVATSK
jgi:hypothetical protein